MVRDGEKTEFTFQQKNKYLLLLGLFIASMVFIPLLIYIVEPDWLFFVIAPPIMIYVYFGLAYSLWQRRISTKFYYLLIPIAILIVYGLLTSPYFNIVIICLVSINN